MTISVWDIPDSDTAILQRAEIEYAGLPDVLADYRQAIIAYAIANWPMLREPYVGGFFQLETDKMPMPQLIADAVDIAMGVIEENLSGDTRHALRVLREHQ